MKPCSFFSEHRNFAISRHAALTLVVPAILLCSSLAFGNDAKEMFSAIRSGNLEKIEALIKKNPEVVFTEFMGRPPLSWAAYCGDPNIVEALLARHAFVNSTRTLGQTPLHDAASISDESVKQWPKSTSVVSHKEVAALLLSHNAYADYRDDFGQTPLHWPQGTVYLMSRKYCWPEEPISICKTNAEIRLCT